MPTYQFEAMDATGQEIKDVIEAASEEEAQATIRQMGYFVTKIAVKKSRKTAAAEKSAPARASPSPSAASSTKVLTTFTRQLSILQDAGLPILAQPENPRTAGQARRAEKRADRRLRRDRRRGHPLRGHGQVPQGLRPPLRQHDQGRRGGRCPGSHPQAAGRVPGAGRGPQTQGQGRDGLPRHGGHLRRRHPGLHHDQDRARSSRRSSRTSAPSCPTSPWP